MKRKSVLIAQRKVLHPIVFSWKIRSRSFPRKANSPSTSYTHTLSSSAQNVWDFSSHQKERPEGNFSAPRSFLTRFISISRCYDVGVNKFSNRLCFQARNEQTKRLGGRSIFSFSDQFNKDSDQCRRAVDMTVAMKMYGKVSEKRKLCRHQGVEFDAAHAKLKTNPEDFFPPLKLKQFFFHRKMSEFSFLSKPPSILSTCFRTPPNATVIK